MQKLTANLKKYKIIKANFSTLLVIFTFAAIFLLCSNFIKETRRQISSQLNLELTNAENKFLNIIDHTESIAKNLNQQIVKVGANNNRIYDILEKYSTTKELAKKYSWTTFSWSDQNFYLTADSKEKVMLEPSDLSVRNYIYVLDVSPNKIHIGDPLIGPTSKKWIIPAGVGYKRNDEYFGATVIGFEIDKLAQIIQNSLKNKDSNIRIFSKNNHILLANYLSYKVLKPEENFRLNNNFLKILNDIQISQIDEVESINLLHNPHAIKVKNLKDYSYKISVDLNKKYIKQVIIDNIIGNLLSIIVSFLGLVLVILYLVKEKKYQQIYRRSHNIALNSNRSKEAFIKEVKNELENFTHGVQGCAEIINNDLNSLLKIVKTSQKISSEIDPQDIENSIDLNQEIIKSICRFIDYTSDLDNYVNSEFGQLEVELNNKIDISKIIKKAIQSQKKAAKLSEIIIVEKIDKDLRKIEKIDAKRLTQIISRLILNSIKYSEKSGVIEVEAKNLSEEDIKELNLNNDKKISIIIRDFGRGFNANEIKNELEKKLIRKNSNISMNLNSGLSLINFFIKKQNGIFSVKSKKNKETTYKIIL